MVVLCIIHSLQFELCGDFTIQFYLCKGTLKVQSLPESVTQASMVRLDRQVPSFQESVT